jgi:lysozyme family protein
MEASWQLTSEWILREEAGKVTDTGGLTKFGISQHAYPTLDIANLTPADALEIYHRDYWLKEGCDKLPFPADLLLFDACVNEGPLHGLQHLQQACSVEADGKMGPDTLKAIQLGCQHPPAIISFSLGYRAKFYADLAASAPDKYGSSLHGWLDRCFLLEYVCLTGKVL